MDGGRRRGIWIVRTERVADRLAVLVESLEGQLNRGMSVPHGNCTGYLRVTHHSKSLLINRGRVSSSSLNVRWNCHASKKLLSARAMVYSLMSSCSTRGGFAVRTYLMMRVDGSSEYEIAWRILEA